MSRKKTVTDGPKVLSNLELMQLKIDELENNLARAEIAVEQKQLETLLLKQKLMGSEIGLVQSRVKNLMDVQAGKLEQKRANIKLLEKKLNLAPGWGFDPDSGEIKEGSDE